MASTIIFAPNVGGGGGLTLLMALLAATQHRDDVVAILDIRGQAAIERAGLGSSVHWVRSNVTGRLWAEQQLQRLAVDDDLVVCFHNLPPLLPVRGNVTCFMQNANLVGLIPAASNRGWIRLRYVAERFLARHFRHRIHRYIVQTPTMAAALKSTYQPMGTPIDIVPFTAEPPYVDNSTPTGARRWDFLYVSDGSAHKNHHRLFAAWEILAEQGHFPTLAVTLHPERDAALGAELVAFTARLPVRIENLGQMPHADILAAYRAASALIFPSYAESFGLPLIEAAAAGLPILAPELDYVRDVCSPAESFDPMSPRSIARAVRRFLDAPEPPISVQSAEAFLDHLRFVTNEADKRLAITPAMVQGRRLNDIRQKP